MTSQHLACALLLLCVVVSQTAATLTRKNVEELTEQEVLSLQSYLSKLEDDHTDTGFQKLAAYHGEPSLCEKGGKKIACCIHGMANFPQWHRLYVVQFEQLLHNVGMSIGVPYWDTTKPLKNLPSLVEDPIFRDPNGGLGKKNAWFSGAIDVGDLHEHTARAVDERLFEKVAEGKYTQLFELILNALEQDNYCEFEVQFEVAHNHIHYLVGGRHHYSLSTLEWSSYDPIFFLHHSAMDRIFVIWQQLQKLRGKSYEHADCSVELFRWKLRPFSWDSNPIKLTKTYSGADDLWSHTKLDYWYDDLELNGLSVEQLYEVVEGRKKKERAFVAFSLHGLGVSANAKVQVCHDDSDSHPKDHRRRRSADDHGYHCEFAGDFFLLGGANEMPWEFHWPYYFDVTEAVGRLHVDLDGGWEVKVKLYHVNGTELPADLLPPPVGVHRPSVDQHDDVDVHGHSGPTTVVRKDVSVLTDKEIFELRQAMARFQNDTSVGGYQATAEYHGLPPRCPQPDAAVRYACCIHGMATFPHWHRLFVVQVEDELRARGVHFGVPYWDWTRPHARVPALAADASYSDPNHPEATIRNPFYDAPIAFLNERTTRDVQPALDQEPSFGDHTSLFDGLLLAFEQTDFCDFEIQFEVVHNAPHFLVGGFAPYSLATLHYSAFDPLFFLHHSNVDRLWAIWQELQILRGLPYKAHCANSMTHGLLKPFGFDAPLNNNKKTHSHARPTDIYDYEKELDYTYDTLQFGGMTVEQLEHYINERQTRDRAFVGIELHNIGVSARVTVYVNPPQGESYLAGRIAVLGGEKEMPWHFDRLLKLEITEALSALGLNYDDEFSIELEITDVTGKTWPSDTFSHSTIFHDPPHVHHVEEDAGPEKKLRSDVESLSREQAQNLRDALKGLEEDNSNAGFNQIAAFHGEPRWCPSPSAEKKYACCLHGMAVFPHWHRLITVQAENALRAHGYKDGLPYWDWTLPLSNLPQVVQSEDYVNPQTNKTVPNPFHHGVVNGHKTERAVRQELFEQPEFGRFTQIAEQVLLAFEQTDFCDFEIQFEIAHNYIHALVGGNKEYSMASLRYTTYDPIFYLHHSNVDRLWAIWQQLQKYRGLPYNTANCALASMRKPLQPFAQTSVVNPDPMTRDHSVPFDVFDYEKNFHYHYDNFQFNGLSIPQLQHECVVREAQERVFAGFMLHGVGQSALVQFDICADDGTCSRAGEFYILGDEYEMPWAYDRLYKYEITRQLHDLKLEPLDHYYIEYAVLDLQNNIIGKHTFGNVTIAHTYGAGHLERKSYEEELKASTHVRKNLASLTEGEKESLKAAMQKTAEDGSFEHIARFHGYPGLCTYEGKAVGCCIHGMATFPHWHRLYVEQIENTLLNHGSDVSIPYWDWTTPFEELPDLFNKATYFDSRSQTMQSNPFFHSKISELGQYTTRDPQPELYNSEYFLENVLLALEQTSYCDFEVQYEVIHNTLHSLVGGRGKYSLSTLDFSAYDPIFFLYHANTDRIFAIWQSLQNLRDNPWDEADCALNHMHDSLHPFDDRAQNEFDITHKYNHPDDVWDYSDHLGYHYDTLDINNWNIEELQQVLEKRQAEDRVFAALILHNIGTSADVEMFICTANGETERNCDHPAGKFSVLGGEYEMPFRFDRNYLIDISKYVKKLGFRLDSGADFDLKIQIHAYNGSYLDPGLLPAPTIIFKPGKTSRKEAQKDQPDDGENLIRRNVWSLSALERRSLVMAMKSLQEDHSADGFQSIASFHALPELCPYPEAGRRYACCEHGSPVFPHWHRLYVVQFEDALKRHGAIVGVPFWDTTDAQTITPYFITDATFHDPVDDVDISNPWTGASIDFENSHTEREMNLDKLKAVEDPGKYDTWSWEQVILALEQENYCDFEVQFEIAHNAIHAWVGGTKVHSMAHLHYASYDPIFILHHSSMDRIFAIWQELQRLRGLDPYSADCSLEEMHDPLKPFSFGSPYNLNPNTKKYSRPDDIFDYKDHFHYEFDDLELQGLNPSQLEDLIRERKEHDRVFAGILLHGIGTSAHVEFSVCTDSGSCTEAGDFNILGGSSEMPWSFDRTYKYDITRVLEKKKINPREHFTFQLTITALNGTVLSSDLFPEPSVIIQRASQERGEYKMPANRIRHDLTHLTERDIMSLKSALNDLQADDGKMGWQSLASYHGVPALCPTPEAAEYACCIHGMPTFPHWHRLYTLAVEHTLINHGSSSAIPYWDWTTPQEHLPEIFTEQTYYDAWKDKVFTNPFARGYIKEVDGYTVRDPRPELWKVTKDGKHSVLFDEVLLALEQDDYCDFEVQFEVTHNAIHYLVGGHQLYSLSSLHYSSYDPIFFVHHSFVDKIWAVWQELQRRRHKPADRAECAINYMSEPMMPFESPDLDTDPEIRAHAVPNTIFNYFELGYRYDNLDIGGKNLDELEELIHEHESHARVFVGFRLGGIGTSADVVFSVCKKERNVCTRAGAFFILGGTKEMPWTFNRLYKYDITDALHEANFEAEDVFDADAGFYINYEIHAVNGSALPKSVISKPTLIYEPAHVPENRVRHDLKDLSDRDVASLKSALYELQHDKGALGYQAIASYHGVPALCPTPEVATFACCVHGMPTFPHWHRLYTMEVDRALIRHGSKVALPYWDWTLPVEKLPEIATVSTYHDTKLDKDLPNPFLRNYIDEAHDYTERDPQPELKKVTKDGEHSVLFDEVLLALEQEDYCDFEVQFEVTHNAIHFLVGGHNEHSLASLHYSSYDPLFFLHHSFVDKLWAVWQELQKRRHKPYNTAECAAKYLDEPLHPFDDPELDPDDLVRSHALPNDAFDYHSLGYDYDDLSVGGKSLDELEKITKERQSHSRIFAGFDLKGIGTSAEVVFSACSGDHCERAGAFFILGGSKEMPWHFSRYYKYDITDVLHNMHIEPEDAAAWPEPFTFKWEIHAVNGSALPASLLAKPRVLYAPPAKNIRHNLDDLSASEIASLKSALDKVQHDEGKLGWQALAAYHGLPALCPTPVEATYACCVHGMPTFPHWHRLYTLEVEHALQAQGSKVAIPYWDWTLATDHLPDLLTKPTYYNEDHGKDEPNPFAKSFISESQTDTTREPQAALWKKSKDGVHSVLFDEVLYALEQDNYCDFEVQFEVTHNAFHYLVGGNHENSLASLHYSSYDPAFFLHHSFVDKIWAVWQKMQWERGKFSAKADCLAKYVSEPLHPFDDPNLDPDEAVRSHAMPNTVLNYFQLGYKYDNYNIGGKTLDQLEELIREHQSHARVFAGFHLEGIGTSAEVEFSVCDEAEEERCERAGAFFILGGSKEMPWSFDRLYKYEITDALHTLHIEPEDIGDINNPPFHFKWEITALNGSHLSKSLLDEPSIIVDSAHVPSDRVRHDLTHLSERDLGSLKSALTALKSDRGPLGWQALAAYHGVPALCPTPEAAEYACCIHGMPTFPHWHRLYTLEVERSLISHGSKVSIPYWDWTLPMGHLPSIVAEKTYYDTEHEERLANPFYRSFISESNTYTARDVQPELNKVSKDGKHSVLFDEVLLALEQDDYCDFEVQFEVTHNAIHYIVGGHSEYSLASLHYSSYDPIFFLHHSFVDKIWTVWQELQKRRHRPYNKADCAGKYMTEALHPFDDPELDPDELVRSHALPSDVFDIEELGYKYDNLEIGGLSLDELEKKIREHQSHARVFAGFQLGGIGTSADVVLYVCHDEPKQCARGGKFFILGGSKEMPWSFDRPYKYDITDALHDLGIEPDEANKANPDFYFKWEITGVNGSALPKSAISSPSIIYQEAEAFPSERVRHGLADLSESDLRSLKAALAELERDEGKLGYQALAAYHGLPALCPTPEAATYACCVHGMPTFPHWHRLYTMEIDRALIRHGSKIAIPYWDWTLPMDHLPDILTKKTYFNEEHDRLESNPFASPRIDFANADIVRDPASELTKVTSDGKHHVLFDEVLLALEQDDYCDFEIQFEVTHNAIHYVVGGFNKYSLFSLHYSSYDPAFFLHHSFVDKLWAVWQELQKRRHKPYNTADCAGKYMSEALHPFDDPVLDPDEAVRSHAIPNDVFDYHELGYTYDNLKIGGKDLDELEALINDHQSHTRVFTGWKLHGIGDSAKVIFYICLGDDDDHCERAGAFILLGGSKEMPWSFDRLYKYDITDYLKEKDITPEKATSNDPGFHIKWTITGLKGNEVDPSVLAAPEILFEDVQMPDVLVRKNLVDLSESDLRTLKAAMADLQNDNSKLGWQSLASYHGLPALCPTPESARYACCVHGMPTFPHWHRLYTLEIDHALYRHGSKLAIPYWDWTMPMDHLPDILTKTTYFNEERQKLEPNPFAKGYIEVAHTYTVRDPQSELNKVTSDGNHHVLFDEVLLTLEQTDYCDFEIQFEVTHNGMHYVIGGFNEFSMASLHYSSYDPAFFLHHSFVDKIWVVWQELQKRRGRPYNTADCATKYMSEPLHPFDDPNLDPDEVIRSHAVPNDVFDYHELGYSYDNLEIGGKTVDELDELIHDHQSHPRVFAGWKLHGIGDSAKVIFNVCPGEDDSKCARAGAFIILGGSKEMPWSFDRPYKYDITDYLKEKGITPEKATSSDPGFHITWTITGLNGTTIPPSSLDAPKLLYDEAHLPDKLVRQNLADLSESDLRSLQAAMGDLQNDDGKLGWRALAAYHGVPALCPTPEEATYACCVHGMPTFPQWHRLYTLEIDHALFRHGSKVAIPYWDWTMPMDRLPDLINTPTYFNEDHNKNEPNPFLKSFISESNTYTVRSPQASLFKTSRDGRHSVLFDNVLLALEQNDYCNFEIQFEVTHNAIHYLVGGNNLYSLSSLHYSSYDPAFFLHHSFVDKLWAVWQELQKRRRKPYNRADCAGKYMSEPLHPFDDPNLDPDEIIRSHAMPNDVFDYQELGYSYDNLNVGGKSLYELEKLIKEQRSHARVFAGFSLKGIKTSAMVDLSVCKGEDHSATENCEWAGAFFILGGEKEMPWAFDRPFKYDITETLKDMDISAEEVSGAHPPFHIEIEIRDITGAALPKTSVSKPTIIYEEAHSSAHTSSSTSHSDSKSHGWSYMGDGGADHWSEMYYACDGARQSPINIVASATEYAVSLGQLKKTNFDTTYGIEWTLINNGHTVQVSYSYADPSREVRVSGGGLGGEFAVVQFHFHWGHSDYSGSEHLIGSHAYPMEVHIVMYNKRYNGISEAVRHSDGLAALGFFFEVVKKDNPKIARLIAHFDEIHEPGRSAAVLPFNLNALVADMSRYYRYMGGLTTPPCSEMVTWTVFKDTIPISTSQLDAFRHLQDSHHEDMVDNFRPTQKLRGRSITKSFT